jgi:putative ABC transport system substrate-binding protein
MKRRELIALVGGAAAAWPLKALAQPAEGVKRIGMLSEFSEAQMQPLVAAFNQQLRQLGWKDDGIRTDLRFAIVDDAQFRSVAASLVATTPDVIVALGSRAVRSLRDETRTIPVVFTLVADPVAQGLVTSLARPDGNLTGLTNYEFSFSGKWFEALKEIEPRISRILLMSNPQNSGTMALAKFVEGIGPTYGVTMIPAAVRTADDVREHLTSFGQGVDRAIIVLPDGLVVNNRDMIIEHVNRTRIPTMFPFRVFAVSGGMLAWGLDFVDVYRQAANYVDRILRGAKPAELPIQAPNKFSLTINLKTAHASGFKIPPTLMALADEVIE